jgi:CRISPR-associated protein Cmr1
MKETNEFTVKIKALTPIWTGDENGECKTLRETGIIGSLRWWYEVLIRGLGGSPCDPTNSKCDGKNHCDACELFGCTGWGRKFRLEVEKQDSIIILKLIELREIKNIEWTLLNKTLQIISKYGALGGKIAEPQYGLIEIKQNGLERKVYTMKNYNAELEKYFKKNGSNVKNPNIKRFIFVHQNLNEGIENDLKNNLPFLKGKSGKGKRYFYKTYNGKPYRLFMYAENDNEYKKIVDFLEKKEVQFKKGEEVLNGT